MRSRSPRRTASKPRRAGWPFVSVMPPVSHRSGHQAMSHSV